MHTLKPSHSIRTWASLVTILLLACSDESALDKDSGDAGEVLAASEAVTERPLFLTAVWGAASDDVWAIGPQGLVLHFDGRRWQSQARVTDADLFGLHGRSADDVWAVGDNVVLHWDGHSWAVVLSNMSETLMGVWQRAADDVWMVGLTWDTDRGLLRHWDGKSWQWTQSGNASTLWEVWAGAGDVWIGGTSTSGSGFLARGEETSFARASYSGGSLRGIWGSSDADLWVAPYDGALQHWNGAEWNEYPIAASDLRLLGVGGTSSRDVWTVGLRGAILHWNGDALTMVPSHTERNLWSVWAASPDDAWAVGGALLHWNGAVWRSVAVR